MGQKRKRKTSNEQLFSVRKGFVDARGQQRIARLLRADRNSTVTEKTTQYNQGMHKSISKHTTGQGLKQMGIRILHMVPLQTAKIGK